MTSLCVIMSALPQLCGHDHYLHNNISCREYKSTTSVHNKKLLMTRQEILNRVNLWQTFRHPPVLSTLTILWCLESEDLKNQYDVEPMTMDPTVKGSSNASMSTPGALLAGGVTRDVFGHSGVKPKEFFKVAFDIGRGDEVQPIRMALPRQESYSTFLRRLHSLFYGDSFERSLRQWEYILVDRGFQRANPLPLTSSNTYYAMVSELLRPKSPWLNAVVRQSVSLTHNRLGPGVELMRLRMLKIPS